VVEGGYCEVGLDVGFALDADSGDQRLQEGLLVVGVAVGEGLADFAGQRGDVGGCVSRTGLG
jgi:hypothetical protein